MASLAISRAMRGAKRHSVTVQSLIESTTSTTVPIGALQFHTRVPRSTWHRVHIHVPFPCAADLRGTGAGGRTREDHSGGHAQCLARSAAHTPQFSRISLWLGSCIPMCRPERHRGSTGAVATTRGSAVWPRARHLSRYARRALRNSRAGISLWCPRDLHGTCIGKRNVW